jgi:PAS domain S-box-containing protein
MTIKMTSKGWRNLFDAVRDPLFVHDKDFSLVLANRSYLERAGMSEAEVLGRPYWEVFPKSSGPLLSCRCALSEATEKEEEIRLDTGEVFLSRDSLVLDEEQHFQFCRHVLIDVTERKRGEDALRKLNRALRMLTQCNQALVHAEDEEKLLNEICRLIVEAGGYVMSWVGLALQDEEKSVRPVAQHGFEEGYLESANISWADTERGRGPTGTAIRKGVAQINQNFLTNPRMAPWRESALKRGYESSIALPLKDGQSTFGALMMYASAPDAFDAEETSLLSELASDLAYGIVALRERAKRKKVEDQMREMALFASLSPNPRLRVNSAGYVEVTNPAGTRMGLCVGEKLAGIIPDLQDLDLTTLISTDTTLQGREARLGERVLQWTIRGASDLGFAFLYGTDITERKWAEEALWKSERKYRELVDFLPISIFEIDVQGQVTSINRAALDFFKYEQEDFDKGVNVFQFLVPEQKRRVEENMQRIMDGTPVPGQEFIFLRSDGSTFPGLVYATRVIHDDNPVGIRGAIIDITDRKKAENALEDTLKRLRKTLGATIQAMAAAVEVRDPYTAGHQRRVSDLARRIATDMKLGADRIDAIRMAGSIHDLGKIAVPAEILSKPTRLTENEYHLIRGHSITGFEILKDIDFPWPIARIVLEHHERINGTGYPGGLKGEDILLESKIMAVADTVEAMASHRPYRPALGVDAALDEIMKNRGVLYDPEAVDACLKIFKNGYSFPV